MHTYRSCHLRELSDGSQERREVLLHCRLDTRESLAAMNDLMDKLHRQDVHRFGLVHDLGHGLFAHGPFRDIDYSEECTEYLVNVRVRGRKSMVEYHERGE